MLADEREQLRGLLTGLESLIRQGDVIVQVYHEKLPSTVTELSEIVMTLKADSGSLASAIKELARFGESAVKAYDPRRKLLTIRLQLSAVTRAWLQPIFTAMGWGRVPCLPAPYGNCSGTVEKKAGGS